MSLLNAAAGASSEASRVGGECSAVLGSPQVEQLPLAVGVSAAKALAVSEALPEGVSRLERTGALTVESNSLYIGNVVDAVEFHPCHVC